MIHFLGKYQMQRFVPRIASEYERSAKKKANTSIYNACKYVDSPTYALGGVTGSFTGQEIFQLFILKSPLQSLVWIPQSSKMVAISASATAVAAMTLAALNETILISGFGYRGNSPQDRIFFSLSVDDVACDVSGYEVPGLGYACSDSGFTFDVLSQTGSKLRLHDTIEE